MVTREYQCIVCPAYPYFVVSRRVTDSTDEACPGCGASAEQIHTAAPMFGFGPSLSDSGGIPDYKSCRSEYTEWQKEKFTKRSQDLHPANVGKTSVTEESYASKSALRAARASKAKVK